MAPLGLTPGWLRNHATGLVTAIVGSSVLWVFHRLRHGARQPAAHRPAAPDGSGALGIPTAPRTELLAPHPVAPAREPAWAAPPLQGTP